MKITFEMEDFNIPLKFIGKSIKVDKKKLKNKEKKTGDVCIRLSNYKINAGIRDDIFDEDKQRPQR